MKLIVGLGNPGEEYKNTRHNAGFMAVDYLRGELGSESDFSDFKFDKKANAEISSGLIKGEKVLLVKPQTFMNSSGQAVQQLVNFFKLDSKQDLLVVYDDLDLPLGEIRTSGTSAGGHNGMQSIMNMLGTEDTKRIRIGIQGKPREEIEDTAYYVLQNFTKGEKKKITDSLIEVEPFTATFLEIDHQKTEG
ncbi:MAG: aminoacyl-tRNA hydrolase [Parcubacteria group bacterium]|nr:aminoacyl-tRNA hydrolase [Parcubacteria group bacterium]